MKLAEALVERKSIKTKLEDLKKRLYQNAKVQEGDNPVEDPLVLLKELAQAINAFEQLVSRINLTNHSTTLPNGMSLADSILKKDMLNYLHMIHVNLADKAIPDHDRFSQREIKFVPTVNVTEIRKRADDIAREYRLLDITLQETNWKTDLV